MSRNRKLYVSELIKRNKNVYRAITIVTESTEYHFETLEDITISKKEYLNKQVKQWYYSEYYGIIIIIK